jgi:hypothetical protein
MGIALAVRRRMRGVAWLLPIALVGGCTYNARSPGGGDDVPGDDTVPTALYDDCADALVNGGETTSGVYEIDPDGAGAFEAYCDMATDGGGWTLALKIDGAQGTFGYDSPLWSGGDVYNDFAPGHDDVEAKLASFSRVRSDHVMIETAASRLWINPGGQEPLEGHVNGSAELAAPVGASAWTALVPGADVPNCFSFEGTNIGNDDYAARVGLTVFGEDEGQCRTSLDAAVGVGLKTNDECDDGGSGPYGPPQSAVSAGVINDGCAVPVFAYVYVRDLTPY